MIASLAPLCPPFCLDQSSGHSHSGGNYLPRRCCDELFLGHGYGNCDGSGSSANAREVGLLRARRLRAVVVENTVEYTVPMVTMMGDRRYRDDINSGRRTVRVGSG